MIEKKKKTIHDTIYRGENQMNANKWRGRKEHQQQQHQQQHTKNLTITLCEPNVMCYLQYNEDIWKFVGGTLKEGSTEKNLYDMKNEAVIFLCLRFLCSRVLSHAFAKTLCTPCYC